MGTLKRIIMIAVAAVAALAVGATVGSTREEHGPQARPGLTAAPQDAQTPEQMCEQAAQQVRAKHPDVYVGECNHGESTLPMQP